MGLLLISPVALAQPSQLQPVVVTATRLAQLSDNVLADVRVIDAQTIRSAGPMSLPELLQTYGGAEIAANGGPGQPAAVFLRGTNANHVVLLVDGMRINSATSGTNAFENIPLDQIERIEILRGPASSLYGADAIGGVIQVFTRSGQRTDAEVEAGSRHTYDLSVGLGRNLGSAATRASLQAGYSDTRAFSATNETNAFFFNPDRDGYRNTNFGLSLAHDWAAGQTLTARWLRSEGDAHFDSGPTSDDVNRQRLSSLALESSNRLSAAWHSTLKLARATDDIATRGGFPSNFRTDQDQLNWQNDLDAAALGGKLAAGLEWRREKVDSDTAYTRTSRHIASAFASYAGEFGGAHLLQASLRHDDNSQFGGHTSGNLAYGYRLTPAWRLSAGIGSAFKAPSFNDLYFPLSFGFHGNPDLDPERSRNTELAVRWEQGGWRAGLTAFDNRIRDLIVVDPTFTTVVNLNRARIRGATLDADWTGERFSLRAEITRQNPRDDATGNRLVRRARTHGSLGVSATAGRWRYGADVVFSGARFDSADNDPTSRMGGYALLSARAAYELAPGWRVSARVDNATDKHYELAKGYNTAGRGVFVALHYGAAP